MTLVSVALAALKQCIHFSGAKQHYHPFHQPLLHLAITGYFFRREYGVRGTLGGGGVYHLVFSRGPGTLLAFTGIKGECPAHAQRGEGSVGFK